MYQVGVALKVRVLFTYQMTPVTGLNSTFTLTAYNPAGSAISGGSVSSAEVGSGFYDVTIASGAVTAEGPYAVVVSTSASPTSVDSQYGYGIATVSS